ncbi:MAG: hypothetical protein PHS44_02640 [Candidatus Dojkabacteria bacterium]|nr:hypothetical protein [Candidatus Dojkabacteria bacterium]
MKHRVVEIEEELLEKMVAEARRQAWELSYSVISFSAYQLVGLSDHYLNI